MTVALYVAGIVALGLQIAGSLVLGRRLWGDPSASREELQDRYGLPSRQVATALGVAMYGRQTGDDRIRAAAADLAGRVLDDRARSRRDEGWRWRWYGRLQGTAMVLALGGGVIPLVRWQLPPGPLLVAVVISLLRLVVQPWIDRNLRRAAASDAAR